MYYVCLQQQLNCARFTEVFVDCGFRFIKIMGRSRSRSPRKKGSRKRSRSREKKRRRHRDSSSDSDSDHKRRRDKTYVRILKLFEGTNFFLFLPKEAQVK